MEPRSSPGGLAALSLDRTQHPPLARDFSAASPPRSPASTAQLRNSESHFQLQVPPPRQRRNHSPYKPPRSQPRSGSTSGAAALVAPPMLRARSLPNPAIATTGNESEASKSSGVLYGTDNVGRLSEGRTSSLRGPPSPRTRSPYRECEGTAFQPPLHSPAGLEPYAIFAPSHGNPIEAIQEDLELDFSGSRYSATTLQHPSPHPSRSSSLRSITSGSRRPSSPLPSTPTVANFNEPFPTSTTSSNPSSSLYTSSHPSTPTSFRSRSPSISSLDPIADAPEELELESEAETQAALESLRLSLRERERERESDGESDPESSSSDTGRIRWRGCAEGVRGATVLTGKKRWSVCGGERRGDLDLETIWED